MSHSKHWITVLAGALLGMPLGCATPTLDTASHSIRLLDREAEPRAAGRVRDQDGSEPRVEDQAASEPDETTNVSETVHHDSSVRQVAHTRARTTRTRAESPQDHHHRLGVEAAMVSQFDLAHQHFQRAAASGPPTAELLNDIGRLYMLQGRPSDAKRALHEALLVDPNFQLAHENLRIAHEAAVAPQVRLAHKVPRSLPPPTTMPRQALPQQTLPMQSPNGLPPGVAAPGYMPMAMSPVAVAQPNYVLTWIPVQPQPVYAAPGGAWIPQVPAATAPLAPPMVQQPAQSVAQPRSSGVSHGRGRANGPPGLLETLRSFHPVDPFSDEGDDAPVANSGRAPGSTGLLESLRSLKPVDPFSDEDDLAKVAQEPDSPEPPDMAGDPPASRWTSPRAYGKSRGQSEELEPQPRRVTVMHHPEKRATRRRMSVVEIPTLAPPKDDEPRSEKTEPEPKPTRRRMNVAQIPRAAAPEVDAPPKPKAEPKQEAATSSRQANSAKITGKPTPAPDAPVARSVVERKSESPTVSRTRPKRRRSIVRRDIDSSDEDSSATGDDDAGNAESEQGAAAPLRQVDAPQGRNTIRLKSLTPASPDDSRSHDSPDASDHPPRESRWMRHDKSKAVSAVSFVESSDHSSKRVPDEVRPFSWRRVESSRR